MKNWLYAALALLVAWPLLTLGQETGKKTDPAKKAIYDEKADAKALIEKALTAAKHSNRRALIQWGGNWCGWCILLHDRFKSDPKLARTLLYEYDVVHIDSNNNGKLAESYGADFKKHGVPYLTILSADGKVVVNQSTVPFETKEGDKDGHDPKKLQEFLTTHQAEPLKAEEELAAALAKAEKSNRHVFLHFGAPWCGWCKRLEAWLARAEIAPLFGKEFVDIEVDIDRMIGGKEVMARYPGSDKGGIPWFVMLDAKGKVLINSNGPAGNVGFPYTEPEIAHFVSMLKTCKRQLTDADIETLGSSLTSLAKADSKGK